MTSDISDFSNGILDNYEASRVMVGHRRPTITKGDEDMRHLGEIGFEDVDAMLLERMVEARNRGSDMRAPARPATEFVATAHLSGGEENSRLRASREGTAAQTEWKGTPTEAGAKFADTMQGEVMPHRVVRKAQTKARRDWSAISASLFTANRNKRVAPPTRFAPALATRLFLCVDNDARRGGYALG